MPQIKKRGRRQNPASGTVKEFAKNSVKMPRKMLFMSKPQIRRGPVVQK
jgi:hypothetical protein